MAILDTANNPFSFLDLPVYDGAARTFTIRTLCESGKFLKASNNDPFAVSARVAGSGAAFESLEGSGLDLSVYAGETKDFEIQFEATGEPGDEVQVSIAIV